MAEEKGTVCVTGAGGYVASWLVKLLLSNGYSIHGTVRDPHDEKNSHLKKLEKASDKLKLFKVDLLDYNSLSAAITGCVGVFHVASPVPPGSLPDPEVQLIEPAVKGTLNVLKACSEANVKRVVVVSSGAAVSLNPEWPKGQVKDETCWSDAEYCRRTNNWYCLSKTKAESEAFEYAKRSGLDVVRVCPTHVLGPMLQSTANASSLVLIKLSKEGYDEFENNLRMIVDVRDVAEALLLAYEKPEAEGRYICTAYMIKSQDLVEILRKNYPNYNYPKNRMASTRSGSHTPSGKGKGPKPYHKANWDWENSRIYLELVIKEIEAGNRPHMSINPNGYRSLAKTYEAATGLTHSMKQLKNKYNQLKVEWRAWSKLMDSRKGPTGIGFDQESGLINASDEWWATMEKVDKGCCKFRTKRLDHEELMCRVFTGAAATGKNAWTPGEMRNQLEVEGEFGSADFSTDINEMGASETANLMKSANINASGSGSKRRHSSVTAVQKKRVTGAEALATSMDDLVNSVKTQSKELTVNHVVGGQSVTMAEAVARLYEIQGLDQTNPLLHFGISLMEVPNNREMVMSIPSDEGIIGWLQVKQQDKERTTTVPTLASILRNQGLRF